jgi:hypothetical protein
MGCVLVFTRPETNVDYTGNRKHAQMLVDKLLEYYHGRGYKGVKVWLEPEARANGKRFWCVRSNITMTVPQF